MELTATGLPPWAKNTHAFEMRLDKFTQGWLLVAAARTPLLAQGVAKASIAGEREGCHKGRAPASICLNLSPTLADPAHALPVQRMTVVVFWGVLGFLHPPWHRRERLGPLWKVEE